MQDFFTYRTLTFLLSSGLTLNCISFLECMYVLQGITFETQTSILCSLDLRIICDPGFFACNVPLHL